MRRRVGRPTRVVGLLFGLAIAAPVLTACFGAPSSPPPPPASPSYASQYCAPSTPSTPAAYQDAFDEMRRAGVEWAAADGGHPITLPDGRTVWLYGDTFTGRIQPNGSLAPGYGLVRNSFIVQDGACVRPLMGGTADSRTDLVPASAGQWYWPTRGVVEGNVLRVFLYHMTTGNNPGPFNFRLLDMRIATFALPDLHLVNVQPIPVPSGEGNEWGASAFSDGSTVYVYANGPDRNRRVARVPVGSLTNGPSWEFFNGNNSDTDAENWSADVNDAAFLQFTDAPPLPNGVTAPWDALNIVPAPGGGTGYLAVGKLGELDDPLLSTEISKWTAPAPQGPWQYGGKIAQTSVLLGQYTYGATIKLAGSTPIVLYSVNGGDIVSDVSRYGVKFVAPAPW